MLYIGIDPGAIMTGIAGYRTDEELTGFEFWSETDYSPAIWDIIEHNQPATVIIEDFIGNGTLNNARKRTIEVLGFVYYVCLARNIKVYRNPPNARLAYIVNVPMTIRGKDERSAAAHCLAWVAKHPEGV
jgi:hypothetical protein